MANRTSLFPVPEVYLTGVLASKAQVQLLDAPSHFKVLDQDGQIGWPKKRCTKTYMVKEVEVINPKVTWVMPVVTRSLVSNALMKVRRVKRIEDGKEKNDLLFFL